MGGQSEPSIAFRLHAGGRAYHEDHRVCAGVDVHHRGIQGHQLVLWHKRVRGNHCAPAHTAAMARTFPVWRASAAATFFLALCSRDSSAEGGTTAAVFLLALWPHRQVSRQAPTNPHGCQPIHSAHAPIDDLPHLDADDVVGRGRAGPRNLGGRNLRAADALTARQLLVRTPGSRGRRGVHPARVPWLIGRHEPATAQALQEARLPGAQVAFHHHLGRDKVAWLRPRRARGCDSGHVAVRRRSLSPSGCNVSPSRTAAGAPGPRGSGPAPEAARLRARAEKARTSGVREFPSYKHKDVTLQLVLATGAYAPRGDRAAPDSATSFTPVVSHSLQLARGVVGGAVISGLS